MWWSDGTHVTVKDELGDDTLGDISEDIHTVS